MLMNKGAVLHIPMSQDAYGVDESHVTFRLRTGRGDLEGCFLYFGDRACRNTPVFFTKAQMQVVARDLYFDYYEVTLENPYRRICYYFELVAWEETILYYGDCFCSHLVDDRSEYYQLPFNHPADIVNPPQWAQDAVIYNIFPDSFATGREYISGEKVVKEYHRKAGEGTKEEFAGGSTPEIAKEYAGNPVKGKLGGTIRGILENVDYLKELGITAVYINPIFMAGEYHKYDVLDYFQIDACLGTNEEFKKLVETFHDNGIKVIIDGVFNHCGWYFFAFADVVEKGEQSVYKDWFYHLEFPVKRPLDPEEYPSYECFGYERMMPKLNTQNPQVVRYFCEVCRYWLTEFQTDGWRLDVASEVNDAFWMEFCRTAKEVNPQAILIGEVWESAGHWLNGKMFDSTMNYDFRKHCRRFFGEASIDGYEFDARVTNMRMRYRRQTLFAQLNLLDSHDVSRFLSLCGGNRDNFMLAVLFQMTFPGMPSVFYGDELGVQGILEEEYRSPMPWGRKDGMFAFYQKAIALRKAEEALRRGEYHTLYAKPGSRLYAYERVYKEERIVIVLNMEDTCQRLPIQGFETESGNYAGISLWQKGVSDGMIEAKGFLMLKR